MWIYNWHNSNKFSQFHLTSTKTKCCNKYSFYVWKLRSLNDLKRRNCVKEQLVILNILMAELGKFLEKASQLSEDWDLFKSLHSERLNDSVKFALNCSVKIFGAIHVNHEKARMPIILKGYLYLYAICLFYEILSALTFGWQTFVRLGAIRIPLWRRDNFVILLLISRRSLAVIVWIIGTVASRSRPLENWAAPQGPRRVMPDKKTASNVSIHQSIDVGT